MKYKTGAVWLALLLGFAGAHWFYLGRKRAWFYLICPPLMFFVACLDALRIGVMPDETFNGTFNRAWLDSPRQTTWLTIVGMGLALAVGVGGLMTVLAIVFQWYLVGSAS